MKEWVVWKTITLGNLTKEKLLENLKKRGYLVGGADWIINHAEFTVSPIIKEIELVIVSPKDLGFEKKAERAEIYYRALKSGLELCPAEVGPQLVLQYPEQTIDDMLLIAMEAIDIKTKKGEEWFSYFDVSCYEGKRRLSNYSHYPVCLWDNKYNWVFRR